MKNQIVTMFAGAAVVVACNSNAPKAPVEGVTTTSGATVANNDAARRITNARCEHANKCNQFGKDKDYADEAGCKSEIGHDSESTYKASGCPHGIRQERLTTCLNEIKNEKCGNLGDKISRAEACRTGEICID